jgi:excisionase family DNA binding protein
MSWYSIREYTQRMRVSTSTVRRQIQEGRLFARKFGRHWYIQPPENLAPQAEEPKFEESMMDLAPASLAKEGGGIQSIVEFSSKALHHYLLMSEKLIAEKDARLAERDREISGQKQEIADLENYARLLEERLAEPKRVS